MYDLHINLVFDPASKVYVYHQTCSSLGFPNQVFGCASACILLTGLLEKEGVDGVGQAGKAVLSAAHLECAWRELEHVYPINFRMSFLSILGPAPSRPWRRSVQ